MRIRKRQAPLPLSSLSPVPLSDPHCFSRSPAVQFQMHNQPHGILSGVGVTTTQFDGPPSDQPNRPIGGGNKGPDCPDAAGGTQEKKKNDCMTLSLKEDKRGGEEDRSTHDFRKGSSSSGGYMATADLAQSHSSGEAVGSWYEGKKAFPLKKRRGNFDRPSTNEQETIILEKNKKMKTKMKTRMNKKPCLKPTENVEEEDQNDIQEEKERKEDVKKRGRGSTGELMEGSRCSRVNGRGWRCCQQTLVGYSLCEHHLGKGRLRSMNSVRSRSLAAAAAAPPPKNAATPAPLSIPSSEKEGEHEDEKKPLLMATKKRVKLGMVKARSISSLLGENNNIAATSTVADGDQNDLVNNELKYSI